MDARAIARTVVEEISATVDKHIHPRTGQLMPPRLEGRHPVPSAKVGEQVIDRLDELVEVAAESWSFDREPEVFLELCQVDQRWLVEWVVETVAVGDGEEEAT